MLLWFDNNKEISQQFDSFATATECSTQGRNKCSGVWYQGKILTRSSAMKSILIFLRYGQKPTGTNSPPSVFVVGLCGLCHVKSTRSHATPQGRFVKGARSERHRERSEKDCTTTGVPFGFGSSLVSTLWCTDQNDDVWGDKLYREIPRRFQQDWECR